MSWWTHCIAPNHAAFWPRLFVFAWLISTGRFKAIDGLRRKARFEKLTGELVPREVVDPFAGDDAGVGDDRLRLIFTCCHPALPADAHLGL